MSSAGIGTIHLDPRVTQERQRVVLLARLGLVLMLLVVVLSAFVRHKTAGLGCTPWPHCLGKAIDAAPVAAVTAARMAHRVVATLALALVASLAFVAWTSRRERPHDAALGLALLAVVLFLAGLGVVTAGSRVPAVAIGNLVGGFAMLALCARLSATHPRRDAVLQRLARGALLLWSLQVLLGATLSASFSGPACGPLAACLDAARASGWDLSALDPWREPPPGAGAARGAALHLLHRAGAVLAVALSLALAWRAHRAGRPALAAVLAAAVLLQPALGLAAVAGGLPLALVLLHNLVAASVLALLAREA